MEAPLATQTTVTLIDDINESEASDTVVFGLDGAHYEIDLTEATRRGAFDLKQRIEPGDPDADDSTADDELA